VFLISAFYISLVLYEILGGSQIYIRGAAPLWMLPAEKIFIPNDYFGISNCIFNFNFVVFEILGGPKFTLGRPTHP